MLRRSARRPRRGWLGRVGPAGRHGGFRGEPSAAAALAARRAVVCGWAPSSTRTRQRPATTRADRFRHAEPHLCDLFATTPCSASSRHVSCRGNRLSQPLVASRQPVTLAAMAQNGDLPAKYLAWDGCDGSSPDPSQPSQAAVWMRLRIAGGRASQRAGRTEGWISRATGPLLPERDPLLTSINDVAAVALSRNPTASTFAGHLEHRSTGGSAEHRYDLPRRRDLYQSGPMPLTFDHRVDRERVNVDRRGHHDPRISAFAPSASAAAGSFKARRRRTLAVSW